MAQIPATLLVSRASRRCLSHPALVFSATALAAAAACAQTAEPIELAQATLPTVEVTAQAELTAGTQTTVSGGALEQATDMKDVVRNQPLVAAPGTVAGTSRNRSSFDRSGTTGYNIRGIEGNRVGMDVDGVEMPDATTRPYVSRAGTGSFGVGRDFIDPEVFSGADINSGTTAAKRSAGGIGGAVSFRTKSASDYLRGGKTSYFGGKLGYDSSNRAWNPSFTLAGQSGNLDGLMVFSHRRGKQTENNGAIASEPEDWRSNALLLKGGVRLNSANRLELTADLYRRKNNTQFSVWDSAGTTATARANQNSDTSRNTLRLAHTWAPSNAWVDHVETALFFQNTDTRDVTASTAHSTGLVTTDESQNKTRGWGLSSTAQKRVGRHKLDFGVNASLQDQSRPWAVAGYMKPQPDTQSQRFGAFIQDEIGFELGGQRMAVVPALRVDRVSIEPQDLGSFASGPLTEADLAKLYTKRTNTIWSPSLALQTELKPGFLAYAQYKRGGRAPSAGEIFGSWNMASNYNPNQYALVGNANLKPETSNAFEVGVKGSPTAGVALNASAFYTRYSDFIAYTRYTRAGSPAMFTNIPAHIGTIYQAENRDDAKIFGLELSSRIEHGQWAPALQGVYSTWALGLSKGTSKSNYNGDKNVDLDTVLPRKAIIGVGYNAPDKRWGLNLTGTFVASKQAVATNRESYANSGAPITDSTTDLFKVPGYGVFDVSAFWQISKNARLNAAIYNLGNKRYWDYASTRSLQPGVARDQRDIQLLTNPGRTVAVSLNLSF